MNRDLKPSTGSCIRTCSAVRRSPCGLAEITSILTPEEYEILRKLYLEKYTYEELAREMGLKKSALAMRVKRSKERFVKQWNRH